MDAYDAFRYIGRTALRKEQREGGLQQYESKHIYLGMLFQTFNAFVFLPDQDHAIDPALTPSNQLDLHSAWLALTHVHAAAAEAARQHPMPHLVAFQFKGTLTTTERLRSNNDLLCERTIGSL